MTLKTLPLLLVMSIFLLGSGTSSRLSGIAQAKDIDIQSGNVRVSKDKNGNIYINTGNSRFRDRSASIDVNSTRSRRINGCNSRNISRQEMTQVTRSGNTVIHTHSSNTQCY